MQAWGEGGPEQEAWEVAHAEIPERAVGRKRAKGAPNLHQPQRHAKIPGERNPEERRRLR